MPGALRLRGQDALGRHQADAHRVHERVRGVGLVEDALAADVRDADAVAVVADPGDRAAKVPVGPAEAQPVEQRDRPRAHRDDVAQDAADAGRGPLERLDGGRVVVRLGLEGDRDTSAEVDHARVLAGPLQHPLAAARQPLEQPRRVLVAAVLGPEQREDRELEIVRRPVEERPDTVELPVGQTERAMQRLVGNGSQAGMVPPGEDGPGGGVAACVRSLR